MTLATPDLAGQAELRCATQIPFQKGKTSYEYQSCQYTGQDARTGATQTGRNMTKLSVATTRRYKDANGDWQEKTQWHVCVAYGATADHIAKIQTGTHVFIEGELVYREYERTIEVDNGPLKLPWPATEIVIKSFSVLNRKEKQERGEAA